MPPHLRDAHYAGAAKLGHGEGYEYPHDFEGHHVEQQYRPERFEDEVYYEWTGQGRDVEVEPGTGVPVGHSTVDGSMPEAEPAPAPEAEPAPKRTLREEEPATIRDRASPRPVGMLGELPTPRNLGGNG